MRDRAKEKEIIAGATEGPWIAIPDIRPGITVVNPTNTDINKGYIGYGHLLTINKYQDNMNDAEFIATARTAWPEDLAWRERAERMLKLLEWIFVPGQQLPVCMICRKKYSEGHKINCELAALLGGKDNV